MYCWIGCGEKNEGRGASGGKEEIDSNGKEEIGRTLSSSVRKIGVLFHE